MTDRIEVIGSNGNDGEIYLVEKVAVALCGENNPYQKSCGMDAGKMRWEYHIKQAIEVIDIVREFDKNSLITK